MPEYLAPGVYVEETSFRAKSVEGVSTSTTAFVGPTRRGPVAHSFSNPGDETLIPQTPELITNFGDFQRIYGSFDDLEIGTNYLALSVRAFFDNGGSRLYVARVYAGSAETACARSADLGSAIRFIARTPGACGRGKITIIPHFTDITKRSMDRAPEGTTLRIGGKRAARAAELTGTTTAPFVLPRDGRLLVRLNSATTDTEIDLSGNPAVVTGTKSLAANVTLASDNRVLTVELDKVTQQITLPEGPTTRESLVDIINSQLVGGFAALSPGGALTIGSDVQGFASHVVVKGSGAGASLGFEVSAAADGSGTLPNVRCVSVADLAACLAADSNLEGQLIASTDLSGHLVLSTLAQGADAKIALSSDKDTVTVNGLLGFSDTASATGTAGANVAFYVKQGTQWLDATGTALAIGAKADSEPPSSEGSEFVTVRVVATDADGITKSYEELGLAPKHPRFIGTILQSNPSRRSDQLENVFAIDIPKNATSAQIRAALIPTGTVHEITLNDGGTGATEPQQVHYAAALRALAQIDDISIVAAPGESMYPEHQGIQAALINHCERRRAYRIAVLDTKRDIIISEAQAERSRIDSTYAALYYPWVIVNNPLARPGDDSVPKEIALPPSGFVCGIYVRTDVNRGVFKAPANEIVRGALRYDTDVNFAQQEVLNPLGVNCLRFFPGRGNRVWGARTVTSDPEWKYVNVRRYFNYLERSIDVGTQWAVFEPNGERLWANIRETISSFLVSEWRSGALLGSSPKEAFFVRCDRSTMDQNDLDNGRLICLIGVAVVKPAEFVIFRIGQKTADARS